jgi:hypothetical protein
MFKIGNIVGVVLRLVLAVVGTDLFVLCAKSTSSHSDFVRDDSGPAPHLPLVNKLGDFAHLIGRLPPS